MDTPVAIMFLFAIWKCPSWHVTDDNDALIIRLYIVIERVILS